MDNSARLRFSTSVAPACRAIVVIPARNEEDRIVGTLSAFAHQEQVSPDQFEILVLLNNCTDDSCDRVRSFAASHSWVTIHAIQCELSPNEANIGTVRRLLMNEACFRFLEMGNPNGAILTTDADTRVDRLWVARNLEELSRGADMVGGRIALPPGEMRCMSPQVRHHYFQDMAHSLLVSKLESLLDSVPWDPWPRHHQHFCGSLAISARMYQEVGGIPHVENLEDVALFESVQRADGKVRHSPQVKVWTSARLDGRAGVGFSSHLRGFENEPLRLVENVRLLARKFSLAGMLRQSWHTLSVSQDPSALLNAIANLSGIPFGRLLSSVETSKSFREFKCAVALAEAVETTWPEDREIPIDVALTELRLLTANPRW